MPPVRSGFVCIGYREGEEEHNMDHAQQCPNGHLFCDDCITDLEAWCDVCECLACSICTRPELTDEEFEAARDAYFDGHLAMTPGMFLYCYECATKGNEDGGIQACSEACFRSIPTYQCCNIARNWGSCSAHDRERSYCTCGAMVCPTCAQRGVCACGEFVLRAPAMEEEPIQGQ